jgi:hypothetical protein
MNIIDFNTNPHLANWRIVNDVIMGGKSNSNFSLNEEGYAIFNGKVSLENNGGFSMVQYTFGTKKVDAFSKVSLRLKGDGKPYQFRIKSHNEDKHSYVIPFKTSGDWETIEIPFNSMYPAYRGRKLDIPNFPGKRMEMIGFLIGNKKAEAFLLLIDSIVLK